MHISINGCQMIYNLGKYNCPSNPRMFYTITKPSVLTACYLIIEQYAERKSPQNRTVYCGVVDDFGSIVPIKRNEFNYHFKGYAVDC